MPATGPGYLCGLQATLRQMAEDNGLRTSGTSKQLAARLEEHILIQVIAVQYLVK